MKVLRKPRLNSTVVSVAVDTAASLLRLVSERDMARALCRRSASLCFLSTRWHHLQIEGAPFIRGGQRPSDASFRFRESSVRIFVSALALVTLALAAPAPAQDWPARQVTIVVPFTAGGTTDMFGRMLANGLQQKYGTPFIVENRAGAGGNLGAGAVARAAADGYTLLVGTVSTHAINPFVYKNLAHDTERDFQPVSLIARLPNMLVVNPNIPAKTVAELIEHLKKNDGKLSYGSSG